MNEQDKSALREARQRLENPGLAVRVTSLLGAPIERTLSALPAEWHERIQSLTRTSLERALGFAVRSLGPGGARPARIRLHKLFATVVGGVGGAGGLPALAAELPVSTILILRSVADIARAEGEDLSDMRARLACLEVFALGGSSRDDDGAEAGYYAVRAALGKVLTDAVRFVEQRGLAREGAPVLARLVAVVARRFGLVVSQKAALQVIPAVGAITGAAVNAMFIDHYQEMARGHFTVRRLERKYGAEAVRDAYRTVALPPPPAAEEDGAASADEPTGGDASADAP